MSDNFIRSVVVDKNGFLWVGTNEGLNSWDGYSITNYSLDENPDIPGKTITDLVCDSENNIWLSSPKGVAWAGPRRNFHRVKINDTLAEFKSLTVVETKKYGPVLITDKGHFYSNKKKEKWNLIRIEYPDLVYEKFADVVPFNGDSVLFVTRNGIALFDYNNLKVLYEYPMKGILTICRVKNDLVAFAGTSGTVVIMNIRNGIIQKEFDLKDYTSPRVNRTTWAEIRMAAGENIIYASNTMGFFIIDKTGHISRYTHRPDDPTSIAANIVLRITGTPNGNVVVGTERYGLSMFNILKKQAVYQKFFKDEKGNLYDGFLTEMVQDKDGSFWMGAVDRLIHWDKKKNISRFYQYNIPDTIYGVMHPEVYRICEDQSGQIWVSLLRAGPAIFNRNKKMFTVLLRDTSGSNPALKSNHLYDLMPASDGKIWVATGEGLYRINPVTKRVDLPADDSLQKKFFNVRISGFAEDSRQRIWISTYGQGVYCYDRKNNTLKQYNSQNGLINDVSLDMMCDSRDNIYVCHHNGFSIIDHDGRISGYTRTDGLRYDKADAFLEDNDGNIWISNAKCLVRFNPVTKKMNIYDEHDNLNNGGFKPSSSLKTPEGELLWGTQSGINYFYPEQLTSFTEPLQLSIYKVLAGDSLFAVHADKTLQVKYRDNNLQFYFAAVNLPGSRNIRYQYKLEGYDMNWQEGTDIRQARYSSLPPGYYSFKVRASADRMNWVDSINTFHFKIKAPLHLQWWFRTVMVVLIAGGLFYIFNRRSRQLKQKKEELETEQAINYFASSMYEHQTVEDILWDVARNCIGRLHFEDCVIYLIDEEKKVLIQKAAHGPKSPRSFEINKPIDIPVGKGIVGAVAASGKPEVISDTSKDPRYIVDDEIRFSEISVPIMFNDKVLGVIDCEHSKKRFFTQKHLSILTTIASLCANKIVRAKTEAEKKQAETMLAETKQKMAEAEMQALRAQMNPHFIFNCLNSINRYIVKSDQATASLYLTRFAKLIRLILDNSHNKNVLLSNELEALRLYIEMESLRFDNKFTYQISVDPAVPADSLEIPPLIIQPYIENAIWHGLLHKTEGGHLSVHLSISSGNILQCVIEDNGVGREKAKELKSKSATTRKSLGMELTENRLLLLNQYAEVHSSVEIIDLFTDDLESAGTKVILKIPFAE